MENKSTLKGVLAPYLALIRQKDNHRYKSWEHCYSAFKAVFTSSKELSAQQIDYLALQLGFYLASWGMYRGSSFLLRDYDYTIHKQTIKIAFEYKNLYNVDPSGKKDELIKLLFGCDNNQGGLYWKLNNYYSKLSNKEVVSMTLITKIILGVFGCIPAYDTYFIKGLQKLHIPTTVKGRPALEKIIDYVIDNNDIHREIKDVLGNLNQNLDYTLMKIVDMYFWQLGQ